MSNSDKTKELLEQLLSQLYAEESKNIDAKNDSYLIAQDDQYLGKIINNRIDKNSIINPYGPFGSPYSPTSIFNPYSKYGSPYGTHSINNPYCSIPPKLFLNGEMIGYVTSNNFISNRISAEGFLYTVEKDINSLLAGKIIEDVTEVRKAKKQSFIEAYDGTFLGKLNPNPFDKDSIFNQFGLYGNKFSSSSIFNQFSNYGNPFSSMSPYNQFTQTPPKIYLKGQFYAYLTKNTFLTPRIDPDKIIEWARNNVVVS